MVSLETALQPSQFGGYFAFLLACTIAMFENLKHLHTITYVSLTVAIALCSLLIFKENPGIPLLMFALSIQVYSSYLQKSGSP